jgi:predicted transcriptional regulator
MTAVQLKSQLIEMIQKEGNTKLLELVRSLLDQGSETSAYRSMLLEGAIKSEQDIAAGRVNTHEEAIAKAKAAIRRNKA